MQSIAVRADGARGREQRPVGGVFGVMRRGGTYRSLLYLALSFPLAWLYGLMVVNFGGIWLSFVIGFGPLGPFILILLLLAVSWALALFERALARGLLSVAFTPMAPPLVGNPSLWARTLVHLRNPVTWKSLVYLLARVPFGIVAPLAGLALLLGTLALVLAPGVYLAAGMLYNAGFGADTSPQEADAIHAVLGQLGTHGQVEPAALALAFLVTISGIFLLVAVLHALNGMAFAWGWFARAMLGLSVQDVRLAEARAVAAEARGRAEHAEQGRRKLILDASHEMRTPVATIRAHIESLLLLEGESLPERVRGYLGITQREAERLSLLVDDLLMLARADTDELRLEVRPVAVGEVVEEVYQALGPLAEREREVTLVRRVAVGLARAYADRERLAQVLLNLVRNAITYTPAGGIVSIEARRGEEPGTVTLAVTDTGSASPRMSCRMSSSASTARMPRGRGARAASGWGFPSCAI